jgi:RNA polymerase sigma-70 factor (ECF subfamily)
MLLSMPDNTDQAANDARLLFESLISAVARGERAAFEQLYLSCKSAVYGFALSILKQPDAAEDVMQDTFLRIYDAAGAYQARGKPMAWILTITRNLALMRLRQRQWEQMPEDDALPAPGDFTQTSAQRMALHAALEILADDERQIVLLHSLSGLKMREIAQLLNIPLSTALSKHRRALSKLEKELNG